MNFSADAFKAYDIRGRFPDELNEELAYQIGRAFVELYNPKVVVIGRDVRLTSQSFAKALANGFTDAGCDVWDIGLCGTEQVYHATAAWNADGGVMITASHNPMEYNGFKLVGPEARPISSDTGLFDIRDRIFKEAFPVGPVEEIPKGKVIERDSMDSYIQLLLQMVPAAQMKPLKVVVNGGNGCAGPVVEALAKHLPLKLIPMNLTPDGTFPNGIPNPLLPDRRAATAQAVVENQADFGVAWDGDFDRCFLFDAKGRFIDSYYLVGFLAEIFLKKEPGGRIIYDPRLGWNTEEEVKTLGGKPIASRGGHAFMKETLRKVNAIYGGEASGHHFFREFHWCDSGMLPWLYVAAELSHQGRTLAEVVEERMEKFPTSGEMNRIVDDAPSIIQKIEDEYSPSAEKVMHLDGIGIDYPNWRFNLRSSNTEPVIRLNLETRGDQGLLKEKTEELLAKIGGRPQE